MAAPSRRSSPPPSGSSSRGPTRRTCARGRPTGWPPTWRGRATTPSSASSPPPSATTGAPGGRPQRVRQDRLHQLAPDAVPDAELPRRPRPPAGPGRDLGRRRQHRQPARAVAPARSRRDPARVLGGRRGAQGRVRRVALLARRRDDRLVRADAPARHQRARRSSPTPTARTTTPRSSGDRSSTASSPRARCPTATPPRTARASSSSAPSWSRPSPRWRARWPIRSPSEGDATREVALPTRLL